MFKGSKNYITELAFTIIGCAIEVHKELGPGLLESVYERCVKHELQLKGLTVLSQQRIPIHYKDLEIDADLRYDLLVEECIIVELKACDGILPVHEAIVRTYMKLLEVPKGLILNFNTSNLVKQGLRSLVNEYYTNLEE